MRTSEASGPSRRYRRGRNYPQLVGNDHVCRLVRECLLLQNMIMETEVINIRVDAETAKTFKSLPEEDRRKLEALLSIRLSEVTRSGESLDAVMQEIS